MPLLTIGDIARLLDVSPHRITYIVSSRRIEPSGRVANVRVFDAAAVDRIRSELRRIRSGRPAA
jgi:DNA-binding transcriptional MerR regulator